jgi:hypothetical protein
MEVKKEKHKGKIHSIEKYLSPFAALHLWIFRDISFGINH